MNIEHCVLVLVILAAAARTIIRCPSDKLTIIEGKLSNPGSLQIRQGGFAFYTPFVRGVFRIDLAPQTFSFLVSSQNADEECRSISAQVVIRVNTDASLIKNAAVRLMTLSKSEIQDMAQEVIRGFLLLTIKQLSSASNISDLAEQAKKLSQTELDKLGLTIDALEIEVLSG